MELKRAIKKLPSEQNLRLLSSLIVSLANKVDSTSEKCINPFTPNTAYAKGSYVTYNNYIYESKLACNDADWVESHWIRLSDTIEELTVDDVKSYLSLTQDQLDTLASIISTEVRLDKCFSSSDTYMRIQDALKEAKQYCITELAKKSTGSFKKANDVSEVTDGNYLYLIFNSGTSKYDIYALVDSNVELLTSVDVNLDNYFTKTEIEADFLKKTDAASTYATITTVDGKVDKTSITTTIDSNSTNDTITGTKAIYDYILANTDKFARNYSGDLNDVPFVKANCTNCYTVYSVNCANLPSTNNGTLYCTYYGDTSWGTQLFVEMATGDVYSRCVNNGTWTNWIKVIRNNDITQTINSSSTDTQVPSAKASYDITKYNTIGLECPVDKSPLEFALENTKRNKIVYFTSWGNSTSDKGDSFSTYIAIRHQDDRFVALFCIPPYGKTKTNNYQNGTWTGWQHVSTTKVADSSGTATLPDGVTGTISYKVINGICYVSIQRLAEGLTGLAVVTFTGLPKAEVYISVGIENSGNRAGTIYSDDGVTFYVHKIVAGEGYGSFSYPVAES